jgi:xanthine dehydrogenase YagR molybdenum-binding subunit
VLAQSDSASPSFGVAKNDASVEQQHLVLHHDPNRGETYREILRRHGLRYIEARIDSPGTPSPSYAMYAFGAHFAEVRVDPDLGVVRITRFVGAHGAGRVLNPKTARSQMMGGMMMGIGMALMEQTVMDHRYGRFVNQDLAGYHVPVNADAPNFEHIFVREEDPFVNPIGVKGLGEIATIGVAAAIANAVYHATGKRIRDLPITPDKLL